LRALQRAIWRQPADEAAGQPEPPDAESAGLFAATDSLVDAFNTAAHVLGADAIGQRG
jgi:hypothetical protein